MNMIENQFQSLNSFAPKPANDFQQILDKTIENTKNPTTTSRSEIDNLITNMQTKTD